MRETGKLPETLTDTDVDDARAGAGGQGGQKGPPFLDVNGDPHLAAEIVEVSTSGTSSEHLKLQTKER